MLLSVPRTYTYAFSAILMLIAYVVHKWLQQMYFNHCNSDLIHVILFSNSDFCVFMRRILDIIEASYWNALSPLQKKLFL